MLLKSDNAQYGAPPSNKILLKLKNPALNYSSGLRNKKPTPLCQGTAGGVFWQRREEQMLSPAHCRAAQHPEGPPHLCPFLGQDLCPFPGQDQGKRPC